GAQALRILGADHATFQVALDLGQLVAIDAQVVGGGRRRPGAAPAQRRQDGESRDRGQTRSQYPEHASPPVGPFLSRMAADRKRAPSWRAGTGPPACRMAHFAALAPT